jgi:hypothetical protein
LISTLSLDIVLIIHALDVALGVVLGLLTVDEVHSLGLGELIDLSTGDTDEELLGELVGDWLAWKLLGGVFIWRQSCRRDNIPSFRCLSSKILKAPNEAAPARASWPKLDWFTSPFWTWL